MKGHSRPGRPILSSKPTLVDINWRGKIEKQGAQLWFVGPDTCKDYLQARWNRTIGPGAVHFPSDLPESYYKGLTAEYRTYGYKRGRKVSWWEKKKGEANEPLDLMVYNLGAAYYLGLQKKTEHGWASLRDRLMPAQGDLLNPVQTSGPTDSEPTPLRPDNFDTPVINRPVAAALDTPPPPPVQPAKVYSGKISLGAGSRRGD